MISFLKILVKILIEHLQSVAERLFGLEQTCAVKGQTIQSNLHTIHMILKGVEDDIRAALINFISPRCLTRLNIGTWQLSCRPLDSNSTSASGSACFFTPQVLWYRWMESSQMLLCSHSQFIRIVHCCPYFILWCWSLSWTSWGREHAVWSCVRQRHIHFRIMLEQHWCW